MYDRVRVEPTEQSWLDAIDFARGQTFEAIVAVGGGSSIDTAKAVNLYTTHPPGRLPRLRQQADRKGTAGPWSAQAALRGPDDGGHRQRDDRCGDLRPHAVAREDRHLEPAAQADARASSIQTTRARHRRPSRPRQASTSCVTPSSRTPPLRSPTDRVPIASLCAPAVPGRQSDQRCLVAAGDADGCGPPRASRRGSR